MPWPLPWQWSCQGRSLGTGPGHHHCQPCRCRQGSWSMPPLHLRGTCPRGTLEWKGAGNSQCDVRQTMNNHWEDQANEVQLSERSQCLQATVHWHCCAQVEWCGRASRAAMLAGRTTCAGVVHLPSRAHCSAMGPRQEGRRVDRVSKQNTWGGTNSGDHQAGMLQAQLVTSSARAAAAAAGQGGL
jgi:hypothetical protein